MVRSYENSMKCKECRYKGNYIPHLDNYDIDNKAKHKKGNKWYSCNYPLPFHADPKAIMEHWGENCRVAKATNNSVCGNSFHDSNSPKLNDAECLECGKPYKQTDL